MRLAELYPVCRENIEFVSPHRRNMATLESLPVELIILIAKYVKASGHGLARLAVISRQWQTHVESNVFSKLSICASDLQKL